MRKILFVCHGNICRSPLAERLFNEKIEARGLSHFVTASSRATSSEEIGNGIYPPMRKVMERHGLKADGHRARRFALNDYDECDMIICMDGNNVRNLFRLIGQDGSGKVSLLLGNEDVPDPWYTGAFEACYRQIEDGVSKLVRRIALELGVSRDELE